MALPIFALLIVGGAAVLALSNSEQKKSTNGGDKGGGKSPVAPSCDKYYADLPDPLGPLVRAAVNSPMATKKQLQDLADTVEKGGYKDAATCIRAYAVGKPDVITPPPPVNACDAAFEAVPDTPIPNPAGGYYFSGIGLRTISKVAYATSSDPNQLSALGSACQAAGFAEAAKCLNDKAEELRGGSMITYKPVKEEPIFPTEKAEPPAGG